MSERKRPGREPGDAAPPAPAVQRKARAGAGPTTRSLPAVQRREAGLPRATSGLPRAGGGPTTASASSWLDAQPFSLHVEARADAPGADAPTSAAAPAAAVQLRADGSDAPDADTVHAHAQRGLTGPAQPLPLPHLDRIQQAFGPAHDVAGISAHVGGPATEAAAAIGASAYASGNNVAFTSSPDLHTAAHEAAHVVQQRSGVSLYGGVGQAGDAYEQHADAVADRVVAGQSAADLLAPYAGNSGATTAIQRKAASDAATGAAASATDAQAASAAATLPAGVDFQAVGQSLTVRARTTWLDSGPLPERLLALLGALRDSGALGWATPAQLAAAAQETRVAARGPGSDSTTLIHFSASIYNFVGLPPGVPAMVTGAGDALIITMTAREFDVAPATIVDIAPARFVSLVEAIERFTGLAVIPKVRSGLGRIHTDGFGGHGVLTFRFERDALDQLFGHDAYQQWSDERAQRSHGDRTGAAAVGAPGVASGLTPAELDRLRAWLAANLPTRAGVGGRLDPEVLKLVDEIDQSPYRDGILAALRYGGDDGHGIDAISLRRELNAATFDAQAQAHGATVLAADQRLDPVWDVPVPARIRQDAGRVTAGENVGFTLAVDIPPGLMSQEQLNRLRFRPFVTSTNWVFEKIDGATGALPPAPVVPLQRVVTGNHTFHDRYTGVTPQPMDVVFELPRHASTGTWRVTALVQHSHFASAVVETQVVVKTQALAMAEARAEVAGDMGELIPGQYDFDTGLLNDHFAKEGTDDGDIFFSHLDERWQATSSADRATHRGAEIENLRSMIARLRADNHGGGHDAAIAAAERQLAKQVAADRAIVDDEADGWRPFELRGTFLSTKGGIGDGPLELYGMSRTRYRTETGPHVRDAVADPTTTRTPDGVRITIRDLSKRFDGDDRTFTGDAGTFEDALAEAFVKLCQAYPPGEVFVMAQSMGDRGDRATREGVGFQLKTGSIGRDIKEAVFDPVVNTAVNLAGMATMIFVPGSAALVMPALIAYNAAQTVDDLVRRYEEGTLRTRDIALGVAQIGLDILPYLGRATAVANSSRALFVLRGVDIGGEVVVMTAGALVQARDIQESQVAQMAQLYVQLVELEGSTHASDPRLLALRQQFDQQASDIRATTLKAFGNMIEQRAMFAGAKHIFAVGSRAVGDFAALHDHGGMVDLPDVEPHYDRTTGRIVGDASKLAPDAVDRLLVERALHLQELAATAAGELGVDPMKIEVVLDDHLSVAVAPDHVRLGYAPGTTSDDARARWKALAAAGGGHASGAPTSLGDHAGGPPRHTDGGDRDGDGGGRSRGGGAGGEGGGPALPNVMARVDEVARPVTVLVSGTTHLGGGEFAVDVGGGTAKVRVVTVDQPVGHVNVLSDNRGHQIELSRDLPAGDVEASLARGLAEVAHAERRRANGDTEAATDALGEHGTGKAFSPRDYGLVAELRTLRRQRLQAELQGEAGLGQLPDIDRRIADVEKRMGFQTERGDELRRMVDVQVDIENDALRRDGRRRALDGERGHAGIEVHTHWMGIVDVEVFRAKAAIAAKGKDDGSWVPLLEQIAALDMAHGEAPDGTITKRSAAGDAISIARRARDQARTLLEQGSDPELGSAGGGSFSRAAELVAEEAARHALVTTPETDFNSSYEIRDELVKHTFARGPRPPAGDKGAAADFENRGYDEYTREALLALAADGVGYTEPSNSAKKMQTRFGEDRVNRIIGELIGEGRLQPGQVDLRFLTMVTTNQFGGRPPDAPAVAVGAPPPGSWEATRAQMVDQLKQKYVGGIDIAGQEFFWFDADVGGPRLRQLYGDLVAAAKARGERLVLRPHVGEGAVDTAEGKPYGRDDHRHRDPDGGLPHYQRARHNLDAILTTLEGLRADGLFDATLVEVRFGHATHTTPAQAVRMKALGITAEVNLGSNVVTGAVDQTAGADGKPQPTEQFDDHALPTLLYYDARTILSTDAHSVMSTSMREEYQRAQRLIEQVLSGARRIRVQAADAGARGVEAPGAPGDRWLTIDELTAEERRRFTRAYEKLYADANDFYQRRPGATPVGDGNARTEAAPDGGRHVTDVARAHGLVATHGDLVFEGAAADVAQAAQAYQRQGYLVTPIEEADGLTVFHVRSGGGDVDLELRAVPATDAYRDMPVPAEPPRDLNRRDTRHAYDDQIRQLPARLAAWEAAGVPLAERARRAYEYRHRARGWARDRMDTPGDPAALEVRDVRVHGTPDGPSFEELVARGRKKGKSLDETYQGIIESSMRPNAAVNARYGVKGDSK
ncbi:MAG: DUF4157 domain-containing protein [Kofleriaceae bacterium]